MEVSIKYTLFTKIKYTNGDLLIKLIKENTMYKYIWKSYASENIITLNHDGQQTHMKKHINTEEIFQEKIKN
jgi:hypothetical protein